jgi:hypothetical protein
MASRFLSLTFASFLLFFLIVVLIVRFLILILVLRGEGRKPRSDLAALCLIFACFASFYH